MAITTSQQPSSLNTPATPRSSWAHASVLSGPNPGTPRSSWAYASVLSGPNPAIASLDNDGDSDTAQAAKNIQSFFEKFDGSEYDEARFAQEFEKTFDKSATGLTYPVNTPISEVSNPESRKEFDYEQLFDLIVRSYGKLRHPLKVILSAPVFKGLVEYKLQGEFKGFLVTVRTLAFVKDGKVMRFERQETTCTKAEPTTTQEV